MHGPTAAVMGVPAEVAVAAVPTVTPPVVPYKLDPILVTVLPVHMGVVEVAGCMKYCWRMFWAPVARPLVGCKVYMTEVTIEGLPGVAAVGVWEVKWQVFNWM